MTRARSTLHRLLGHPLVAAGKRPLKNALWLARGRNLANPSLPLRVASMLFICKGNICRSPFAALRAVQLLQHMRAGGVSVSSAGLAVQESARPPDEASQAAAPFGVAFDAHRAQQLTRELLMAHDITVVMEADQLRYLRDAYPDAAGRVILLALLDNGAETSYERFNISDPFGQPLETFEHCYRRIDRLLQILLGSVGAGILLNSQPAHGEPRGERQ